MTVRPQVDFAARRKAALAAGAPLGVDALLIGAIGSGLGINTRAQGYMRFLAGWDSVDTPSLLLLRAGHPPLLLVASPHMAMLAGQVMAGSDIAVVQAEPAAYGKRLAEALGPVRRIGICGRDELPVRVWEGIAAALPDREWRDAAPAIAPLRRVKDAAQLALHREAASICDAMFARIGEIALIGRPGYAIKADLDHVAFSAGADGLRSWLTIGRGIDCPRYFPAENRQIAAKGDLLMFGVMLTVEGVWGHAVRSFHLGPADDSCRRAQDAVVALQAEMADAMRPGRDLTAIAGAALAKAAALPEALGMSGARLLRLGHGLGYAYADPILSDAFPRSFQAGDTTPAAPMVLERGMVFELHPLLMAPLGGAGIGDTLVVEAGGATFLTNFPRQLQELPD